MDKYSRIKILNKIDAEIAMQGFYIRFSYKQKYISSKNYLEGSKRLEKIHYPVVISNNFIRENLSKCLDNN